MEKRKKESSLIQHHGKFGKIRKLISSIINSIFPKKQIFYVTGEKNALTPAMSRRQIAAVKDKICKAAIKGFNSFD